MTTIGLVKEMLGDIIEMLKISHDHNQHLLLYKPAEQLLQVWVDF